jgi:hypothetical protein
MQQSATCIATAYPRDLLNRARQILNNANRESRDLSDVETGRVDEILDIVSTLLPTRAAKPEFVA